MANNEDFDEANEGSPAADIPNLKKKEKERKKAGVAWSSGAKPGGAFSGAAGGTVARSAASVVAISGQAAAVGASGIFGLSSTMIAAGAGALLIGGAAAGYLMFGGGGAKGTAGVGDGNLGALASSLKIRGGGGDRTGYVASKGEISFDPVAAAAKIEAAPENGAAQGETAAVKEDTAEPLPDWRQGLAHNLSGTKLSSSFGNEFGGKNIFAGNTGAPKLNDAIGKMKIAGGQGGKLSATRNAKPGRLTQGVKGSNARAKNAFGQLKVAKGLSMAGAGTTAAEGARSTAGTAFDGQSGEGNVATPGMPDATTAPNTLGTGAPDMTAPNVNAPNGVANDANLAALNGIGSMAKQAGAMKKNALMLILAGGVFLLMGLIPFVGIFFAAIGLMLIAIGTAMMLMAGNMKDMANSMSKSLADRTGNINQNATNQYCIDKAYNEGTDPQNCNPPDSVTQGQKFDAATNPEVTKHKEMVRVDGQVDDANGTPIAP